MKPKMMLKMGIDLVMTVLLLCQMAYMLVGETAHEYLGTAMFVLFILHHLLNRNWYRSLKKGRYGAVRILQTAVNTLMLLCMLGLMVSGVILSREQIEQKLFSYDYMGASNMVEVYIRYLRRKIDEGQDSKLIQTVRGAGYVLREGR